MNWHRRRQFQRLFRHSAEMVPEAGDFLAKEDDLFCL
jgi:hypothetical protein